MQTVKLLKKQRQTSEKRLKINSKPIIAILAGKENFDKVGAALGGLKVELKQVLPEISALEALDRVSIFALIIYEVPKGYSYEKLLGKLTSYSFLKDVPFFILASRINNQQALLLYKNGASLVLNFTKERDYLGLLIADFLGIRLVQGKTTSADNRLARSIRAHLNSLRPSYVKFKVGVKEGVVTIGGSVDSLWKRSEVANFIAQVPGVKRLILEDFIIITNVVPDRKLKQTVDRYIANQPYLAAKSLSTDVVDGQVSLRGTVQSNESLQKLISLVEHIEGVREVINSVVVMSNKGKKELVKCKALQQQIKTLFPKCKIKITLYDDFLLIDGTCPTLAERLGVGRHLQNTPGVSKVIDKIIVRD